MKILEDENDSTMEDKPPKKSGGRVRKRPRKTAKEVIVEMVSLIPREALDEQWKENSGRWNCGLHCAGFVPSDETDTPYNECRRRNSKTIERKKRCDKCKVKYQLKVEPDWIDELDEELEDEEGNVEIPEKRKEWRDHRGIRRKAIGG